MGAVEREMYYEVKDHGERGGGTELRIEKRATCSSRMQVEYSHSMEFCQLSLDLALLHGSPEERGSRTVSTGILGGMSDVQPRMVSGTADCRAVASYLR